jgi:hypothetical protein
LVHPVARREEIPTREMLEIVLERLMSGTPRTENRSDVETQ